MARIGLSPYGNPVESGIDTMSKVMSMFNQRDQMHLNQQREQREQEDSDTRRQIQGMTMQREQNTLDEQAADKPIKDADRETKKMQQMYGPTLDGLMARQKAWKPGDNFELTPEETGMIKHFADKTGSLGTDAESQIKAATAIQSLGGQMQQVMGVLQQQGAQAGPARIDDLNHPEILKNVNSVPALRKMLTGDEKKTVTSVLIDPKTGSLTAAVAADRPDKSTWGATGKRADGSDKSYGWQGTWKTKDGKDISELSVGVEIDGKEVDVPTLIPSTTPKERKWIVDHAGDEGAFKTAEGHAIIAKAADFASTRIAAGKSPFASDDESPKSVIAQDDDGYKQVKFEDLQNFMRHAQKFAPMLYQANAQLHGDPKHADEVQKQMDQFDFMDDKAAVMEKIKDGNPLEQRQQYIKEMLKKGHNVSKADAEEVYPVKTTKPRNLSKVTEGVPGRAGMKRDVLVDQDTGERTFTGEGFAEFKPADPVAEEMKKDRLARGKEADTEKANKSYESAIKDQEAVIQKTEAGKGMSDDEVHDEAKRVVDLQRQGKPAGKSEKQKQLDRIKPLNERLSDDSYDHEYTVKSAAESGNYTEAEIRKAATSNDAKAAVVEYFAKHKKAPAKAAEKKADPAATGKRPPLSSFES